MTQFASLVSDESPRTAILATFAVDACIVADLRVGVLNGIAHLAAGTVDFFYLSALRQKLSPQR